MVSSGISAPRRDERRAESSPATLTTRTSANPQASLRLAVVVDLVAVGALALLARSIGLTRQSLWLDEAYSVYIASHRLPQIFSFTAGSVSHPPFYFVLLHTWMTLFGPSELAVRGLSLVASVAAALMAYIVASAVASRRVALLASGMMIFSSFQVWYAQETRMYALVAFTTLIAIYGLLRAQQDNRPAFWVIWASAMLVSLYLDYSAFYVCLAVTVWFVVAGRRRPGVSLPFVLSGAAIVLGYLPWAPSFLHQLQSVPDQVSWILGASGTGVVNVITDFFFNHSNLSEPSNTLTALVATGLSLAAFAFALWAPRRHPAYPLLAFWVGCPLGLGLISEVYNHPITISRTMMVVQPELLILLALAVDTQMTRYIASRDNRIRLALSGLLLGALLVGSLGSQVRANTTTVKEDWSAAAAYVATHQQPGDLILFNAYFAQMPFDYYYHQLAQSAESSVAERGYLQQESVLYADLAPQYPGLRSASDFEQYGRVWLIVSHASSADAAIPPELAAHFQLVSKEPMVGVTVLLYTTSA